MENANKKLIMVVPTDILFRGGDYFNGFVPVDMTEGRFEDIATRDHVWMERELAEKDPSHKQIIPYIVLKCGESVFVYKRSKAGTDSRLHERLSLGAILIFKIKETPI